MAESEVGSVEQAGWKEDPREFLAFFQGHTIFVSMQDEGTSTPWHFHDGFDDCVWTLIKKNSGEGGQGGESKNRWGAFFTVNELDESLDEGRHRTAKMWKRSRAVFMDDDNRRDTGDWRREWDRQMPPSLIVESSPGKFHYYWLIHDGSESEVNTEEWQRVQMRLVKDYKGDNQARDLARYLRLPGSTNWKNSACVSGEDGENDEQWVVRWRVGAMAGLPYPWQDIIRVFPPIEGKVTKSSRSMNGGADGASGNITGLVGEAKSRISMINEIKAGSEYHGNLLNLAWQMKQDGLTDDLNVECLRGMMMQVPDELKDARWKERYDDIGRMVEEAEKEVISAGMLGVDIRKLGEIVTSEEELRKKDERAIIPLAPGRLGGLIGEAYDMQHYQYKEVATVSACGLVAGICGRRFNVNGLGLNVYLTLIMETGMGKDSIGRFISGTLKSLNEFGNSSSFIGRGRFTGPKAVIDSLKDARCQVSVFTEAGLLLKSKAGDQIGLGRMLLSLYSASGDGQYNQAEAYSKKEDSIASLRSPCLSIVNEATPITLHEAFQVNSALDVGDLPRQSIFRVTGHKPYLNMNAKSSVNDEHLERLNQLVKKCQETQAHDDPKVHNLTFSKEVLLDVQPYANMLTDMENSALRAGKRIDKIMLSRAFVKALKYAAIATVYNHFTPIVQLAEWQWAKDMVEYEMNGINGFFRGSGEVDEADSLIKSIVAPVIVKYLSHYYKASVSANSASELNKGIFNAAPIRQLLRNQQQLANYNKDSGFPGKRQKSGTTVVDEFLKMMEEREYIRLVSQTPKKYKVTNTFRNAFL